MQKRTYLSLIAAFLAASCAAPAVAPIPYVRPQPVQVQSRTTAPAGYYRQAEGKAGDDLLVTLCQIVTKHKDLGYGPARDVMFGHVDDLDNDDVVFDIYSGRAAAGVTNRYNAYDKGLNCEHTWPQSLGASGPAKSDLHHLFPADTKVNSARSNHPFGEVAQTLMVFTDLTGLNQQPKLGTDVAGNTVFEPPLRKKGDIARAILYFYTVYAHRSIADAVDLKNFRIERNVLVRWHLADPVDALEQARNDAIYKYQGNRNPYVDRPDFVMAVAPVIAP